MKSTHKKQLRGAKAGFSMMEMLIVLAFIGLIAGITITSFQNIFSGGQTDTAHTFVNNSLKAPLLAYQMKMGGFPSTEQGIMALIKRPQDPRAKHWSGPYIDGDATPLDPWGTPYQYRYPGIKNPKSYDLWSYGPDKVESEDDIGNWED